MMGAWHTSFLHDKLAYLSVFINPRKIRWETTVSEIFNNLTMFVSLDNDRT